MDKLVRYECGPAPYEGCWVRYEDYTRLLAMLKRAAETLDRCRYSEQPMAQECFALIAEVEGASDSADEGRK